MLKQGQDNTLNVTTIDNKPNKIKPIAKTNPIVVGYYLICYFLIIYFSLQICFQYGLFENNLRLSISNHSYYHLTIIGILFLFTDYIYKYLTYRRSITYYALQLHHIVGIISYLISYLSGFGQILVTYFSLFEISSIPLLFYSDRVKTHFSLPLTWFSYLIVRILFGNMVILGASYNLWVNWTMYPLWLILVGYFVFSFFFVVNNYWFSILSQKMYQKHKSQTLST